MKNAVCLTTIHDLPHLRRIREAFPSFVPVVAGDLKSDHASLERQLAEVEGIYLSPQRQMELGFTHAAAVPWNCYGRKNVAYLYALREGAEVIWTLDNDNYPVEGHTEESLVLGGHGYLPAVDSSDGWVNIYRWAEGDIPTMIAPRGFPWWLPRNRGYTRLFAAEVRVGVQVGLHTGDPDVDAFTRLAMHPNVSKHCTPTPTTVLAPGVWTPYDTQHVFFARDVAPLHMPWASPSDRSLGAGWRRFDDILASYVAQSIMLIHGYHVVFGSPWACQERNPHENIQDLGDEVGGLEAQRALITTCRGFKPLGDSMLDDFLGLAYFLQEIPGIPRHYHVLANTWVEDLRQMGFK